MKEESSENLFTDPKLISLIKNDLEDIKMRQSISREPSNHSIQSVNSNDFVNKYEEMLKSV